MKYVSVAEVAKLWGLTERSVRKYCADGKIEGAFLTGKTWNIPENAIKPKRKERVSSTPKTLLTVLKEQKEAMLSGGIYHRIQIDLTYNSNTLREVASHTIKPDIFLKQIRSVLSRKA